MGGWGWAWRAPAGAGGGTGGDPPGPPDRRGRAQVPPPPHPQGEGIPPAVAQHDPDAVEARPDEPGHVIDAVEDPFLVIRPARVQDMVTHAPAVDRSLLVAEPGDREARPGAPR